MASSVQELSLVPGIGLIIITITIISYMMGKEIMGHFMYERKLLWATLNPLWANTQKVTTRERVMVLVRIYRDWLSHNCFNLALSVYATGVFILGR